MKILTVARTLAILIVTLLPMGLLVHTPSAYVTNTSASLPTLGAWSPDLQNSNITSLTRFPVGSQFTIRVNLTNAGLINGIDVSISYNITSGPNVLQAIYTGTELSGGIFDPAGNPSGCGIFVAKSDVDIPPGRVRFAVATLGGCSVVGTGTLFTLTFMVIGTGATSIDVIRTDGFGRIATSIIGPSPTFANVPFQPVDAYFRNKPGIPPVALFTYSPPNPVANDTVTFDASHSYDPDNSSLPGRGVLRYHWYFGDQLSDQSYDGVIVDHRFVLSFDVPAVGSFTVHLVVWDVDNQLPGEMLFVVKVGPGIAMLDSTNWSGYAIAGLPGAVTDVKGSWKVPGIVGTCPSFEEHAAMWVGIDGLNSHTVEQTGTDSACINGVPRYFAWYEFFPRPSVLIKKMIVHPGDVMSAEVHFVGTIRFKVTITDMTTGVTFSKIGRVRGASLSSAEWIAEAPSSGTAQFPLAQFGTVGFGQDATGVLGTCAATIGGVTGPIGFFGSTVAEITMVNQSLLPRATPTSLSKDKTSFTVIWSNF